MPYVQRYPDGSIRGEFTKPQPDLEVDEWVDEGDEALTRFRDYPTKREDQEEQS